MIRTGRLLVWIPIEMPCVVRSVDADAILQSPKRLTRSVHREGGVDRRGDIRDLDVPNLAPAWVSMLELCDMEIHHPGKQRITLWDIFYPEHRSNTRGLRN
jgi:hypothetical protein